MLINKLYKHIDNGGIAVEVHNSEDAGLQLKFETTYFGYPSIETTVHLMGVNQSPKGKDSDFLKELGLMLIETYDTIEKNEIKNKKTEG